jgi:putative transposase
MGQSLTNLLVHLVFSTKDRVPYLADDVRLQVHAYLAGVVRNTKSECYRVGGTDDHVHLAIRLHRTVSVSDLIEDLKTGSSKWIKAQGPGLGRFAWQRGYGAFSLGASELMPVLEYIAGQEEHHLKVSFQDELRAILLEQGIVPDERYLWE